MNTQAHMMRGTVYTQTARFDGSASALTEDELRRFAPSIFAVEAHESRSDRFAPIPTIEIVRGLAREGFSVVGALQSRTRDESKREYTKHLLRLRRLDDGREYHTGDTVVEQLLKNANDGSCNYELMAGLFRICCLNSLVAQTATIDRVKVRHSGNANDVMHKVIEGTYRVLGEAQHLLAAPQDWGQIEVRPEAAEALAEAAHVLRFGAPVEVAGAPTPLAREAIEPRRLLTPRRAADRNTDLWSRWNVVQENVLRGGLHGVGHDADNRRRNVTTRPVNGIDQSVQLNQALWVLGERMAQLLK